MSILSDNGANSVVCAALVVVVVVGGLVVVVVVVGGCVVVVVVVVGGDGVVVGSVESHVKVFTKLVSFGSFHLVISFGHAKSCSSATKTSDPCDPGVAFTTQ